METQLVTPEQRTKFTAFYGKTGRKRHAVHHSAGDNYYFVVCRSGHYSNPVAVWMRSEVENFTTANVTCEKCRELLGLE